MRRMNMMLVGLVVVECRWDSVVAGVFVRGFNVRSTIVWAMLHNGVIIDLTRTMVARRRFLLLAVVIFVVCVLRHNVLMVDSRFGNRTPLRTLLMVSPIGLLRLLDHLLVNFLLGLLRLMPMKTLAGRP